VLDDQVNDALPLLLRPLYARDKSETPMVFTKLSWLNQSVTCLRRVSKQQTGLRIDRILFKQFQKLCAAEKLRPGEAVESLVRLAVQAGSIAGVQANIAKQSPSEQMLNEMLFRSRLSRLRASLEQERRYLRKAGDKLPYSDSGGLVKELAEMTRGLTNLELIREFQDSLADADKLYEEAEKIKFDGWIAERKKDLELFDDEGDNEG
jgi:hypothetical protein